MSEVLPDAAPDNWVDRHAPPLWRPWLKLGRFDRPAGIWLLMLPGWQGVALACAGEGRLPDWTLLLRIALGAALMRSAGCAYNDIVDRDIDAQVARTAGRPLPSGQLTVRQAWGYVISCCVISAVILLTMGLWAIVLGVLSLGLVAAYPYMKRITWWPQAWLGLTFNWGALLGFAAAAHHLSLGAILLYLGGIAWTLGYDTIYAVQDIEDDALAGVKSTARLFGDRAPVAVLAFYVAAFALALAAACVAGIGPLFLPFLGFYAIHLSFQARKLRLTDPEGALKLFRSNRDAGLILFVGLAAGLWAGAAHAL